MPVEERERPRAAPLAFPNTARPIRKHLLCRLLVSSHKHSFRFLTSFSLLPQEEDDIAQLERQALEDLGLLHINEATQEETSATSCTSHDNADNDLLHSATSNFPRNVTRGEPSSRPLSTCSSNEPAVSTLDQHKSWYKVASTCPEEHSSFSPVVRFANPTPVKGSRSVSSVHNTLYNGFSKREGRGPRCSKDVSANSLSLRSAVSPTNPPSVVQRNTTVITEGSSRFRWETNGTDDFTSVFRPATCDFRRTTKALAQEALLDMEVSSYMVANHGHVVTAMECRPMNPLARVFLEGDAMVSARLLILDLGHFLAQNFFFWFLVRDHQRESLENQNSDGVLHERKSDLSIKCYCTTSKKISDEL